MMVRLSCHISEAADLELDREITRGGSRSRKGKTLRGLMELVLPKNMWDHHISLAYEKNDREPCTLNVTDEWLDQFQDYRVHHAQPLNVEFFKIAILRGLSIRMAAAAA